MAHLYIINIYQNNRVIKIYTIKYNNKLNYRINSCIYHTDYKGNNLPDDWYYNNQGNDYEYGYNDYHFVVFFNTKIMDFFEINKLFINNLY